MEMKARGIGGFLFDAARPFAFSQSAGISNQQMTIKPPPRFQESFTHFAYGASINLEPQLTASLEVLPNRESRFELQTVFLLA